MPSPPYLRLEKQLAAAHRSLWAAYISAVGLDQTEAGDELYAMLTAVALLQEALLKSSRSAVARSSHHVFRNSAPSLRKEP